MAAEGLFPGPFGVGHESVAEVVEVGPEVTRVRAGERVLVPYQVSCGACVACRDRRYGACHTYRAQVGGAFGFGPAGGGHGGAAVTVENTVTTDGLACTLRSTDDYGYCTSVAIHFAETTPLPLLHMYTKGITLHLSRADSRRFLPDVIDLVSAGRLDPSLIPTRVVSWDDAEDGWLQPAVKLVVSRSA
jgi:threonine dehydrogenase-like Zn-dependent dehydrogenase